MGRAPSERIEQAAEALLSPGERVTSTGKCWAVQARARMPLLLLARRRYVVALTDRRVLVFNRGRGGPEPSDLVIGKRYETFDLERVRRRRPLLQVVLKAANGNRLVFEFRRGERELAGELVARLTPPPASPLADATFGAAGGAAPKASSLDKADPAPDPVAPIKPWPVGEVKSEEKEHAAFWRPEP